MKHVELITELLLGVNAGVHLNKKSKIDEIIRGGGLGTEDLKNATLELRRSLAVVAAMLPDLRETRFHQLADFYSLVILVHRYRDEGRTINAKDSSRNALAGALLREFGLGVDEVADQIKKGGGTTALQVPFRDYLMTVREGTDSAAQRKARERLLRNVMDGVFDELDPKRTFSAVQRRILWHASAKKLCSYNKCEHPGRAIARWEDLSIDHIDPYIRGGRTDLSNAGLTHRDCNSAKGARAAKGRVARRS